MTTDSRVLQQTERLPGNLPLCPPVACQGVTTPVLLLSLPRSDLIRRWLARYYRGADVQLAGASSLLTAGLPCGTQPGQLVVEGSRIILMVCLLEEALVITQEKVSNERKNLDRLGGEFLVASRLTQRGYMVTVEWGTAIEYDILIFDKKVMLHSWKRWNHVDRKVLTGRFDFHVPSNSGVDITLTAYRKVFR